MIDYDTVQSALHTWVSGRTGLTTIWARQNGARPVGDFATLDLRIGGDARDWAVTEDNPTPSAGQEIQHVSKGLRKGVLTVQIFGGAVVGSTQPSALLDNLKASLPLPSVRDALSAAKIGVYGFGQVLDLSAIIQSSDIESRASMEINMNLVSEILEYGTYISIVDATNEIADPDTSVTIDGGV